MSAPGIQTKRIRVAAARSKQFDVPPGTAYSFRVRELPVDFLREEVLRLRAVVPQTKVLHPCGKRLHSAGDPITGAHVKVMTELGVRALLALEPGEEERELQKELAGQRIARADLRPGEAVEREIPGSAEVIVRRRDMAEVTRQAEEYLARIPARPAKVPRQDTRLTRMLQKEAFPVRPLLVPQARVLVAVPDDFLRALLVNTVLGAGHEVQESRDAGGAAAAAKQFKPDAILADLADAAPIASELRKSDEFRMTALLAVAEEGRHHDVYKALMAGANGAVPKPPRREVLLEAVRAGMEALGRAVRFKPAVTGERRKIARGPGHFVCTIRDTYLTKPLPVTGATVLDIGEGGLQIEYTLPAWPLPHAYAAHEVHPRHFFYNYARDSALGREISIVMPAPGTAPLEAFARFVHLRREGNTEIAGLAFVKVKGSVTEHVSTIRRQK